MTHKELVTKANRDYPIGTRFISVSGKDSPDNKEGVVVLQLFWQYGNGISHSGIGYIYTPESGWAKILSYPKGYIKENQYEIY